MRNMFLTQLGLGLVLGLFLTAVIYFSPAQERPVHIDRFQKVACAVEEKTASRFCFDDRIQREVLDNGRTLSSYQGDVQMRFTPILSGTIAALPSGDGLTTYEVLKIDK